MRAYCDQCRYPVSTCLCNFVRPEPAPADIIIVQHSKEAGHAKNTARLVALGLTNCTIVTEQQLNEQLINGLASRHCAVLYPDEHSQAIESAAFKTLLPEVVIVIDGSWKQAYGMMQRSAWLQSLPHWHFTLAPESGYAIRHTRLSHSLSTLEAVAYCLEVGYQFNSSPLYALQQAMQSFWQGPAEHRR